MRIKTVVERNDEGILVMLNNGQILAARDVNHAKQIIKTFDSKLAKENDVVVNTIDWHGFTNEELL